MVHLQRIMTTEICVQDFEVDCFQQLQNKMSIELL